MQDEPNIPSELLLRLQKVAPVLAAYFRLESVKMGGGTILQARWQHRFSTDIELFAFTQDFNETISRNRSKLERSLHQTDGVDIQGSWVESNAIYCVVGGVEVTVLPFEPLFREDSGFVVPGTSVQTETTATILVKKLFHRMFEGGVIEVRDLYDIHAAANHDMRALQKATGYLTTRALEHLSVILQVVPKSWLSESPKTLLGVPNPPTHDDLINHVRKLFETELNSRLNGAAR